MSRIWSSLSSGKLILSIFRPQLPSSNPQLCSPSLHITRYIHCLNTISCVCCARPVTFALEQKQEASVTQWNFGAASLLLTNTILRWPILARRPSLESELLTPPPSPPPPWRLPALAARGGASPFPIRESPPSLSLLSVPFLPPSPLRK